MESSESTGFKNKEHAKPKVRKASDPFDRDDADLIVRSSDHVDFYVHRLILSLASPVFASMLSLPQPPGTDPVRPVVDVAERSEILDVFFRVLYPTADPELQSLSTIREVLESAMKYDVPAVVAGMRRALSQSRPVEDNPLRVFAIACYFGMEAETKVAAEKAVLNNRVTGRFCAELNEIPAGSYYRLLQLNRTRKTTKSKSSGTPRVTVDFTGIESFCEPPKHAAKTAARRKPLVSVEPPFNAPEVDLILRSCDSVEFRVSRAILALASPTMLQRVVREPEDEEDLPSEGCLPVYRMVEDSALVDALLRICYPVPQPALTDLDLLLDVLAAGRKYGIKKAEQAARDAMSANVALDPLRLYLAAAQCGWAVEARMCADELLRSNDVSAIACKYHADMETTSNRWYRYLLFYLDECCRVAAANHDLTISMPTSYRSTCPWAFLATGCSQRYPNVLGTVTTPPQLAWLAPSFKALTAALKERPRGSTLATNNEVANDFIRAVAADPPPCLQCTAAVKKCTAADNVSWACAVLQRYAEAVDEAVRQVPFELPESQ
ncbi:hypothetical protein VTO73DRAFT_7408 [Trametes versicolor]